MEKTVAETIKNLTKLHIKKGKGVVIGQCLTAVGWVQNTVPAQKKGIIELPMTDVSGAGIAVGASLKNCRPIFILRFQSFLWLNASPIINHAAKALEIFGYKAPIFIRAIASEGISSGPVHTNCYHSPFAHMPGLPICAPMSPNEYMSIWKIYLKNQFPLLVSEHRISYKSTREFKDIANKKKSNISLFLISAVRFQSTEILKELKKNNIIADLFHVIWLKPFELKKRYLISLNNTKLGLVIDSTYEICSISEHIAYTLMHKSKSKVFNLGMEDKSPGCSINNTNGTPNTKKIINKIKEILNESA
jgi:acetoin:2,6-dichlorophenolindophenol oxidoreductase subunit beta